MLTTGHSGSDLSTALVAALEETIPRYLRSLRQAVEASEGPHRLTMPQLRCLQTLARVDGIGLTTGLARQLRVAVPTMTRMLDGLAERGLVERRPDRANRRQVHVLLTAEGRTLLARYESIIAGRLHRLLARLDDGQQRQLLAAIADLETALALDTEETGE